ncbi:hypothetical protein EUX98_g5966 [Antrodiella citrinella]|uniref:Uncharacterized protein n=1 Tax=Antrodiella citrinella TaxID=2447956 RepID=A0A4S4MQ51_9APHY|nr:hypothetical protein EUX98_g5966 [Antrodiella citrinella]
MDGGGYHKHIADVTSGRTIEDEDADPSSEWVLGDSTIFRAQDIKTYLPVRFRHFTLELDKTAIVCMMSLGDDSIVLDCEPLEALDGEPGCIVLSF